MSTTVEAIYEIGHLRLLAPLPLPEHTRVRVSIETADDGIDREAWLKHSQQTLATLWDNDADDVYNELLTR
jgi:predicted DNA-binding antitoxin AbrB/MazE fold protein